MTGGGHYSFAIRLFLEKLRVGQHARKRFFSVIVLSLAVSVSAWGRAVPDANDPLGFFTTVADKMLRSTFPFGITNIPVWSNGVFVYTPAVQRLLQLSANIYDAANTNALPVVFRPLFFKDAANNIFIIGYSNITSVDPGTMFTSASNPLYPPYRLPDDLDLLATGVVNQVNLYGVPWIIGAKKGLPGFNQFYMINAAQVTRKLQVTRTSLNPDPAVTTYATNQMYVMGISNNLGISFWNSYNAAYPRPLTIYAFDSVHMAMTNSTLPRGVVSFSIPGTTINAWPGSQWNVNSPGSTPKAASFFRVNWSFNYLNDSVCRFNANSPLSFDPIGSPTSSQWDLSPLLPQLPQVGLMITNYLQAFILDGSNVVDYVQLQGLVSNGNLNQILGDPDFPDTNAPNTWYQWSTNTFRLPDASPNWGLINQLNVSGHPFLAPSSGGQWSKSPGMPAAMGSTPDAEAAFFNGFFTPSFQYQGQTYVNSQLAVQAPYTVTRTVFSSFLLQANDPLVHYLASDLDSQYGATAVWANNSIWKNGIWAHIDNLQIQPLPQPPATPIRGRYQPWLQPGQMNSLPNVIPVTNNYAVKDPLIKYSDNWNFPTNLLSSLVGLGQVHRGTPWQTFYLKDADMLKNFTIDSGNNTNYLGTNTWMQWTADFDANDAALMAPVSDWRLAGLLLSLLNTNDATQLFSVNDLSLADWQSVLNGLTVYSNSASAVFFNSLLTFDTYVIASNSPPALVIANAITQARASQPTQNYFSIGDILAAPALTRQSPFLNLGSTAFGQQQMNYGISDADYEAIPAGLLPLLRPDSIGSLTPANGGWNLSFSGADGYAYAVQTSTNLMDWNTVSTNASGQGGFTVPASPAAGSPSQFFRSVLLP